MDSGVFDSNKNHLLEMGFIESEAEAALIQTGNDLNLAISTLLTPAGSDGVLRLTQENAQGRVSAQPCPTKSPPPVAPTDLPLPAVTSRFAASREAKEKLREKQRNQLQVKLKSERKRALEQKELEVRRFKDQISTHKYHRSPAQPKKPAESTCPSTPTTCIVQVRFPDQTIEKISLMPTDTLETLFQTLGTLTQDYLPGSCSLKSPYPPPGTTYNEATFGDVTLQQAELVPRGTLIFTGEKCLNDLQGLVQTDGIAADDTEELIGNPTQYDHSDEDLSDTEDAEHESSTSDEDLTSDPEEETVKETAAERRAALLAAATRRLNAPATPPEQDPNSTPMEIEQSEHNETRTSAANDEMLDVDQGFSADGTGATDDIFRQQRELRLEAISRRFDEMNRISSSAPAGDSDVEMNVMEDAQSSRPDANDEDNQAELELRRQQRQERIEAVQRRATTMQAGNVPRQEKKAFCPTSVPSLKKFCHDTLLLTLERSLNLPSLGYMDPETATSLLQALLRKRVLSAHHLRAFRGCPIARMNLDLSPRTTNDLLQELSRKVSLTELSLKSCDNLTLRGIQSITRLKSLKELNISSCKVTDEWMDSVGQLVNLESLDCQKCPKLGSSGLCRIANSLHNLRRLDLSGCCNIQSNALNDISKFVNLEDLLLNYVNTLTDTNVGTITRKLTKLERLEIQGCSDIGNLSLRNIGLCLPALRFLNIRGTACTGAGFRNLAMLHSLEEMLLPGRRSLLDEEGLEGLAKVASLKRLSFEDYTGLQCENFACLSQLTNLEELSLANTGIIDGMLAGLLPPLTKLTRLNLERTLISDTTPIGNLVFLRELNLGHTRIDDNFVDGILGIKELEMLNLRHTQITILCMYDGLSTMKNLKVLNIEGTPMVQDSKEAITSIVADSLLSENLTLHM